MDNLLPQLVMRLPTLDNLPPIVLPAGFEIHTEREDSPHIWEWLIRAGFDRDIPFSKVVGEACYSPDRIFFVSEHGNDCATSCAYFRDSYPGEGYLHMVSVHPFSRGRGAGYIAVLAALHRFREDGFKTVALQTDDFRLPAINMYLKLGFEPVHVHESSRERWKKVFEELDKMERKSVARIYLWPGAEAPYTADSPEQEQPSIKPFPVEGARGAVVICPGGGYNMKAGHEGDPIALMLNQAGISAYVLDYRVRPCNMEAPLGDAKRAIRVVRSLGYDKVGILGFSAGGHLTCSAATLYDLGDPEADDPIDRISSRPDAFIPCYAVVSFTSFRHQGSVNSLLGENAGNTELLRRFSAELSVDENTPPAFIWHTANDAGVPVENSLNLASALSRAKVPFELHIYPDGAHGLGLAGGKPPVDSWTKHCQDFLLTQGFGPK